MANHLTPTELAREAGLARREVLSKCLENGVPVFKGRIDNVLGILDKRLAGRAYVIGSEPTIADLSLVGYLYYPPEEFGFDVAANYKNIAAWLGRIKALPGWTHPYELMPGYPLPK